MTSTLEHARAIAPGAAFASLLGHQVGEGAGQTIFHLHWHVLGGRMRGMPG